MIDGITPQYPKPRTPLYKVRILGFVLGSALAASVYGFQYLLAEPTSLVNQLFTWSLPQDISDTHILVGTAFGTQLVRVTGHSLLAIPNSTGSETTFESHRNSSSASISRTATGEYEVRANTTVVYRSAEKIVSASVSPDGSRSAFTQLVGTSSEPTVMLVGPGNETRSFGSGAAPFFLTNTRLAWFSPVGVVSLDVATSSHIETLATGVRLLDALALVVSPDARFIAWIDPVSHTIEIRQIENERTLPIASYPQEGAVRISLSNTNLFALREDAQTHATVLWKYPLQSGGAPSHVAGLPPKVHILQFIP